MSGIVHFDQWRLAKSRQPKDGAAGWVLLALVLLSSSITLTVALVAYLAWVA